jgi:hypothetical protein
MRHRCLLSGDNSWPFPPEFSLLLVWEVSSPTIGAGLNEIRVVGWPRRHLQALPEAAMGARLELR